MIGMSPLDRLSWLTDVATDARLSVAAIRVAAVLARRQNEKTGRLNPSAWRLSADTQLTDRAVRAAIKQLEQVGRIKVDRAESGGRGRANSYVLVFPETLNGETLNGDSLNTDSGNSSSENTEQPFRKTVNGRSGRTREVNKGNNKGSVKGKKSLYTPEFLQAWDAYPNREGGDSKSEAFKSWSARLREGHSPEDLIAGAKRYSAFCDATAKTGTAFVKQARTFFGPSDPPHFRQPWTAATPSKPGERSIVYQTADF